jgi:hypothetical protein
VPAPDVTRAGSSKSYGSGGAYAEYELVHALRILGNGVIDGFLNELAVTYDGAGLDLDVATGGAMVKGIPAIFSAVSDHAVATARDATNPKACYLVVEVTGAGETEEGKVVLKDSCGAAAASPSLPALTQTEALYQLPLASFVLPNSGSTTLTSLVDLRNYLMVRNPQVSAIGRRIDPAVSATATSTTGEDAVWTSGATSPTLLSGVTYDLEARGFLLAKISDAAQSASMALYLNGVGNISAYVATTSTDYVAIANVHTLEGVVGAGAAATCGMRLKVSGGTMTYLTGYCAVIARPRT